MPERPSVLVGVAGEKVEHLRDMITRGEITRPVAAVYSWDELNREKWAELSSYSIVIHFPFYAEPHHEQSSTYTVSPKLAFALREHATSMCSHVVLIPSDKYRIREPNDLNLQKRGQAVEKWNTDPGYRHQRLTGNVQTIIGALCPGAQITWSPTTLHQRSRTFLGRPYLAHLLDRWLRKHTLQHVFAISSQLPLEPLVTFDDLEDALLVPRVSRGKGSVIFLPYDSDDPDWESVDLLIQIGCALLERFQGSRSHFAQADLILDWPEVELVRPEFGEHSLTDLAPKLRKLKEHVRPLTAVDSREALRDHVADIETAFSNLRGVLHIIETWNVTAATQSRDAIRADFDGAVRMAYEEVRDAIGFLNAPANPLRVELQQNNETQLEQGPRWDAFIAHASEDKGEIVEPLAASLGKVGLKIWYDRFELTVGDSLLEKIDDGLARSRFGIVVLSHHFFRKKWTRKELDGLNAREVRDGKKVILPIWHKLADDDVAQYSPTLAGKLAARTESGMDRVVHDLLRAMNGAAVSLAAVPAPDDRLASRRFQIAHVNAGISIRFPKKRKRLPDGRILCIPAELSTFDSKVTFKQFAADLHIGGRLLESVELVWVATSDSFFAGFYTKTLPWSVADNECLRLWLMGRIGLQVAHALATCKDGVEVEMIARDHTGVEHRSPRQRRAIES